MPKFKKGQSGNPGGRPKTWIGFSAELLRRHGRDAKGLLDELDALCASPSPKVRLEAIKVALAYHAKARSQHRGLERKLREAGFPQEVIDMRLDVADFRVAEKRQK